MVETVLHLSHTDIRHDSRILKQLKALGSLNKNIVGIGVNSLELDKNVHSNDQIKIVTLELFTKKIKFLPRFFRHIFNFGELNFKLISYLIKFKPSVVHCHDTTVLPIGVVMSFFYNYTIIYDAHELESNRNGQGKFFSSVVFYLEKILWKRIDIFISVSDSIIEWYNTKLGPKKSCLILNSPDIKIIENHKNDENAYYFHNLFNINKDRKIFIYLGIIGEGRGIHKYIEVFKNNSFNADIVFVGYGELTNYVKESSEIFKSIHYHNPVKHDEVVSLVKSADYGLCFIENISLSDYYCLPNKLFEYAFSGLTIIGSDFPEIRKVVQDYNLGYTTKPEVSNMISLISTVVDKPKVEFKNLYELSWPAQVEKLLNIYSNLN